MGVPECDTSGPVKKRQRLSLKSARNKSKSSPDNTKSNEPKQSPKSDVGKSGTSPQTVTENAKAKMPTAGKSSAANRTSTAEEEEEEGSSVSGSTTTTSSSSRSSETRVPPVSSLENLGNTCFMNSVMQVLRYTPGFLDNLAYLFEDIQASEKIRRKNKLKEEVTLEEDDASSQRSWKVVKNLYKVFRDLSLLEEKYEEVASEDVMSMAVKPSRLLNAIREMNAMFEGNMQHDAQEFLRCLLTYLQDAEKEGRKFFTQLPQRFSPRATINPIMQKFLQSAQEMIDSKTEPEKEDNIKQESSKNGTDEAIAVFDNFRIKPIHDRASNCEKVKVNLLSKLSPVSEPSGSDTNASFDKRGTVVEKIDDLTVGPKVGDTATEVENSLKGDKTEEAGVEVMETTVSPGEPDKGKCPMKGKGKSGKEKKSKDPQKKRSFDSAETNADEKTPVVQLQRNTMAKKRLGMRGAVVVKSADDILCSGRKPNTKSANGTQSPTEAESAYLGDSSDVQTVKQEPVTEVCASSSVVRKCKSESAVDDAATSFQNMFAKFVSSIADDDDSIDLISDSDSEDIVTLKKKAKELHDTPRRSPRKSNSIESSARMNKPSPLIGSRSDPAVSNVRTKLSMSFNSEKEVNEKVSASSQDIEIPQNCVECPEAIPESVSAVTSRTDTSSPPDSALKSFYTSPQKSIPSSTSSPALDVAMEPFVKLENCDFIFNKNETSVSASYATKYLSPYKRSPRKVSSNYLKQRNYMEGGLNGMNEKMWQAALTDVLNSPVKSRSKYDLIERLFQGTMMLRTQCLNCESSRERTEDFHDVSVPVRIEKAESDDEASISGEDTKAEEEESAGCSLIDLIEASTEVERLTADNKYFCDECQCYVEAEISTHYDVMPDILTLHLKRFSAESMSTGNIIKISDHVNIPMTLPCIRYKCPKTCLRPDHKYQLYSIITHTGGTLSFGHYLAYVRAFPKKPDVTDSTTSTQIDDNNHNNTDSKLSEGKSDLTKQTSPKKVPVTRRKAGVTSKLPSRFNNSVSDTKVKTFANLVAKKSKPDIRETLRTSSHFTTEWFECDDETVRVFNEEEFADILSGREGALLGTPYLLFYHKATLV